MQDEPGCWHEGDKLQFGLAVEKAKSEGHQVEMVLVADDCSLPGQGVAGRRGIAGALLVTKVSLYTLATISNNHFLVFLFHFMRCDK